MGSIQDELQFCFVCDQEVLGQGICMSLTKTNFSNTDFPTKISQMIGDTFMVIVGEEDMVCTRCANLINKSDKLEVDLLSVKKIITALLNTKYNLNDQEQVLEHHPANDFEQFEIKNDNGNISFPVNASPEVVLNNFPQHDIENESNQILSKDVENLAKSVNNDHHLDLETNIESTVDIKAEPSGYKYCNQVADTSENEARGEHFSFDVSLELGEDFINRVQEHNTGSKKICESLVREVKKEILLDNIAQNTDYQDELKFNKLNMDMPHHALVTDKKPLKDIPSLIADNVKPPVEVLVEINEKDVLEHIQITPESKKRSIIKYKRNGENNNPVKKFRPILPKITSLANFLKLTGSSTLMDGKLHSLNSKIIKSPRSTQKTSNANHIKLPFKETFVCSRCQNTFEDLISLRNHRREFICPFVCTTCGESFKSRRKFARHCVEHTGRFTHYCEVCGRGFTENYELTAHLRCHTKEAPYVCEVCGKTFQHHSSYWIHRRWHDNPLPYQCEHCGRKFKHTSRLSVHRRLHTGERPYHCTHCPLTFNVKGTLKRHIMLHTKQFAFNCEPCGRGFTTGTKYRKHMTSVHKIMYEKPIIDKKAYKVAVYDEEGPNADEGQSTFGVPCEATENMIQFEELCENVVEIIPQSCEQLTDAITIPNDWLNG